MPPSSQPGTTFERLRAAIDEWLDAFDAESSELVRAELAQITPADSTDSIMLRIEKALEILEGDATRLHELGEEERRTAVDMEQRAFDAIRMGDDSAAKDALEKQNDHLARATQHFDDALQLKWLLNQYRSAAAAIQNRDRSEE